MMRILFGLWKVQSQRITHDCSWLVSPELSLTVDGSNHLHRNVANRGAVAERRESAYG